MRKPPESGFTRNCPKCKCCLVFCPCFFCCQPDQTLERSTLIKQHGGSPRRGRHHVNHDLIHSQMEDDFVRIKKQKTRWKRRWCGCCFCSCLALLLTIALAVILLAVSGWLLVRDKCDWQPRAHFGAAFAGERLILVGGRGPRQNFGDVWESKDMGKTWTLALSAEEAPFQARHGHALLFHDFGNNQTALYLLGGDAGLINDTNLTATGENSTGIEVAETVETHRRSVAPLSDVWRSTDFGRSWELRTTRAWPARKWFGAVVSEGVLFVMGGLRGHSGLSDVWRSDDEGVTWEAVTQVAGWSGRHSFALVSDGSRFFVMGGDDGRIQQDVWQSETGQVWQLMRFTHVTEMTFTRKETYASWTPRNAPAVHDSTGLLMVGGETNDTGFSREVWILEGEQWQQDAAEALWSPRRGHQVLVNGEGVVYLLGGQSQLGYHNDIWSKETNVNLQNLIIRIQELNEEAQRQALQAQQLSNMDTDIPIR